MSRLHLVVRLLLPWLCLAGNAHAQLHLPALPPGLPAFPDAVDPPLRRALSSDLSPADPLRARHRLVDALLRREPRRLERDPAGEAIVRSEVLLSSPSVALLDAAQAAGFRLAREQRMAALGLYLVTLQAPTGMSTPAAAAMLRHLDPDATLDFNHVYLPGGQVLATGESAATGSNTPPPGAATAGGPLRIGLVDGGVAAAHPALRQAILHTHGCGAQARPDAHGTAVASLLVGRDGRFQGAAPGAMLYAADIYCGAPANGTAEAVVQALAWMAQERVPVINLSIVGPPNQLLERAVGMLAARGHLLVAAVGNDGPAAAPLYPAGYASRISGVVAVTGVDVQRRALVEAGQGRHVMLAAPGAALAVADAGSGGYATARGTSFAAPLAAGLLAASLPQPDVPAARQALQDLARHAVDLGAPGPDPVYGLGLVGETLRVDPQRVDARR